jgi:hypothetical protein
MTNGPEDPDAGWAPPASPTPTAGPDRGYQQHKKTNGFAVASLVLGILGLPVLCPLLIPSILALIFGLIARRDIKKTGQGGDGLALAGVIMGAIGTICSIVLIIVAIVYLAEGNWHDSDGDDVPNFIDKHPSNPNLSLIRPLATVAVGAVRAIGLN